MHYNGFNSEPFDIVSGVPQGSNLGPLLFVLFLNPLFDRLSCNVLAYADDLKLYAEILTDNDVVKLQEDINILCTWCANNSLILNAGLCKVLTYSKSNSPSQGKYFIDGVCLPVVNQIKDLGVIFTANLNFTTHISEVALNCSKLLGFIIRNTSEFKETDAMKALYFSFIMSRLEYASDMAALYGFRCFTAL